METIQVNCEIEVTLHMIGGKCKPLILYILCDGTARRFGQLLRQVTHISQKTLTVQLRELERDGLITRTVFAEVPPRVEYAITPRGQSLFPLLEMMCEWGEKNAGERFLLTNPQCVGGE